MSALGAAAARMHPEPATLPGCFTLDRTGAITQLSAEMERLFGYELAELKGRPITALFGSGGLEPLRPRLERLFAAVPGKGSRLQVAAEAATKNNGEIPVRISLYPLGAEGQAAFVAFVEPLAGHENCRALASRLLSERERQGRSLARIVHRELAQEVATAKLNVSLLRGSPSVADPKLQDRLERVERCLASAAASAQKVCESLYPPGLDELGLAAAFRALAEEVSATAGVTVRIEARGEAPALRPERAIFLYRIVEEAIWSAARNSRGEVVTVFDCSESNRVRVEICDEGAELSEAQVVKPANVWATMRALAALIPATCEVSARPGAGTSILVETRTEIEEDESPHSAHRR